MIKYWILSFIRPGQISQGALYLSSWLSSIVLVINCLISEFLTLTPNITLQFATCYPKYEPQAIGSTGITLHRQHFHQHFHLQQSKQEWQWLVGTCPECDWSDRPQVLQKANEGASAWAAESLLKIINTLAHARASWAMEPQETSQRKRLLDFNSNNLNKMQGN